jgi:hypothetical protein
MTSKTTNADPSKKITASSVRFIKLGTAGRWEETCITGQVPCIRLGFRSGQHEVSLRGDWNAVWRYWSTEGKKTKGKATEFTNQVRTFYTADACTLWITFWNRRLYWCFASPTVEELEDGTRIRRTLGKWSSSDVLGNDLLVDNLSGSLTKVQGFRGTICSVDQDAYLLKRLNGESLPEVEATVGALGALEESILALIRRLGWKDFELLCDLILTRAGWQRVGSLGRTQKTIDLELLSPVTALRAWAQVKSQADVETFTKYVGEFRSMSQYREMFFLVHSPSDDLEMIETDQNVHLIAGRRLAKLVVASGLTDWLVQKVR